MPTLTKRHLTESERWIILRALEVACDMYTADAAAMASGNEMQLAEQFGRQCEQAQRLADVIESADTITLTGANNR